ncbi:MAG: hypothetical protein CMI31_12330 [Opitutae bacterium]|nr:hypothetical protein [Opitutae bacterium]
MSRTVTYFAILDPEKSPGVANKIDQTLHGLELLEYKTSKAFTPFATRGRHFAFALSVLVSRSDLLVIRNTVFTMFLLFPVIILKRLTGARVVVDLPIPNRSVPREIWMSGLSLPGKLLRIAVIYLNFPWSLWSANRILQYSEESPWFSLGNRSRTKLVTNGISVDLIPLRKEVPSWPSDTLVLVGVAALAPWHGFDRVIRAIALHQKKERAARGVQVKFMVVGQGRSRDELDRLARELEVEDLVDFRGVLRGSDLDPVFDEAHLAVSSLGLFRNDFVTASVLKAREYTARGIPFVHASRDPDFEPLPPFVYEVGNEEAPLDIEDLIEWYTEFRKTGFRTQDIREYASERLDYLEKVRDYFE